MTKQEKYKLLKSNSKHNPIFSLLLAFCFVGIMVLILLDQKNQQLIADQKQMDQEIIVWENRQNGKIN